MSKRKEIDVNDVLLSVVTSVFLSRVLDNGPENGEYAQGQVLASPISGNGPLQVRKLVASDIPTLQAQGLGLITGLSPLVGGQVIVSVTLPSVCYVWPSYVSFNGTPGSLMISNQSTSGFTVTSSEAGDFSTIRWFALYSLT